MINVDRFTPFFGIVENSKDPKKNGRYQVRVFAYNSANPGVLPTEVLKWFPIVVSNSAAISGLGDSPTGLEVGSMVFGFYIDKDLQEGLIIGAVNGLPGGRNDVSEIATGGGSEFTMAVSDEEMLNIVDKIRAGTATEDEINSIVPQTTSAYVKALKAGTVEGVTDARGSSWSEPSTPYAAEYPNNKVFQTKSGHVVEYDDTPGAERIMIFHKSGTFEEFHPDGKKVSRHVGQSFDIHLEGHNIFVNGDLNLVASGDYRVSVGGEYYVKASNVVIDTPTMDVYGISNANDHVSSNVSGAYHIHDKVMPGPGVSGTPVGASTEFTPSPKNAFNISVEDSGYTPEVIAQGLKEGFLTQEDVVKIQTEKPEIVEVDDTPPIVTPAQVDDCKIAIENGKVNYETQISASLKLKQVSRNAAVSSYEIVAQRGLTEAQIICNLQNLATNVFDKIIAKYPSAFVTSGFRRGNGKSQHEKGEAFDIQFRGFSADDYYNAAVWIKNNLPFDQIILEKTSTSHNPWIHVSLTRGKTQRGMTLTSFNGSTYHPGLAKLH